MRKPFQGVVNIIRFNWHFYAIAFMLLLVIVLTGNQFSESKHTIIFAVALLAMFSVLTSLAVSFYVYDLSGFYKMDWIKAIPTESIIVNINAGFDETSNLLKEKFKDAELVVFDFYYPAKHTEVSIKRARLAYPPFYNTKQILTNHLPLTNDSIDNIFVTMAAHEIRNEEERTLFFNELKRAVKPSGCIYITEHLRDLPNFLAYTIGFFHFYSKENWMTVFGNAGLTINQEIKYIPLSQYLF